MKVLIACEESQAVCTAFRSRGHEAYSCDILPCSGGHPEWHILGDALEVLKGGTIVTMDGVIHNVDKWDLIIAHPPCTYLCRAGMGFYNIEKYGKSAIERAEKRRDAIEFFMRFVNADCDRIAIENPLGIMSTYYRKPDQYIQPFQFGNPTSKKTGLWLKNLPLLTPTEIVEPEFVTSGTGRRWDKWYWESSLISNHAERSRFRSKTFPGIAEAMAGQWG